MWGDKIWLANIRFWKWVSIAVITLMLFPACAYAVISQDTRDDVLWLGNLTPASIFALTTLILAVALVVVVRYYTKAVMTGPMEKVANLIAKQDVREALLVETIKENTKSNEWCRRHSGQQKIIDEAEG